MAKHSKRFLAELAKVDRNQYYQPDEALSIVKSTANAKFDETVEVHLRMGVDPRYSDQQVRGVVTFGHLASSAGELYVAV
jgi:large subunit ribosomal protein L1